jgi:hypothetical protein
MPFLKTSLIIDGMVTQIWAFGKFFPDFGHTNPSTTRCY